MVVLASQYPERQGRPHNSRATSCERMHPNLGEQDGAVAVSFVMVDRCLGVSQSCYRLASGRVGTGVQPLQGENYTYSLVLGYVHSYSSITSSRVVTLIFLPPSSTTFPAWIAAEVQGEEVPASTWAFVDGS